MKLDAKAPPVASVDGLCKAAGFVSIVPPVPPRRDLGTAVWVVGTPGLTGTAAVAASKNFMKVTILNLASKISTTVGVLAAPVDLTCRITDWRSSKK